MMTSMVTLTLVVLVASSTVRGSEETSTNTQGYEWGKEAHPTHPTSNTVLVGCVRREIFGVKMVVNCAYQCKRDAYCASFNYYSSKSVCELNYLDHENKPNGVKSMVGVEYHKITEYKMDNKVVLGKCAGIKCPTSGICIEKCNGKSQCLCYNSTDKTSTCKKRLAPKWSLWSEWQECSVSCGQGFQARERKCLDPHTANRTLSATKCVGKPMEYRTCSGGRHDAGSCPHWKEWSDWSGCTTGMSCGLGTKNRTRQCSAQSPTNLEEGCVGSGVETSRCHMPSCYGPIRFKGGSEYGSGRLEIYDESSHTWGAVCLAPSSNFGLEEARVACRQAGLAGVHPDDVMVVSGEDSDNLNVVVTNMRCHGNETTLQLCRHDQWHANIGQCRQVTVLKCQVNGGWSPFTPWSECSVTCDEGVSSRERTCNHPAPQHGGKGCEGEQRETRQCRLKGCSRWEDWSPWSECDVTCGNGTQVRRRKCYDEFGKEASDCAGDSNGFQICVTNNCAGYK